MPRAFLVILNSFGIGNAPDAAAFGDAGSGIPWVISAITCLSTCRTWQALALASRRKRQPGAIRWRRRKLIGRWGYATEVSKGKDTITGHWEIATGYSTGVISGTNSNSGLPEIPDRRTDPPLQSARPPGAMPCVGHQGDRGFRRRACENGKAHRLHQRQLGLADRRP